MKDSGCRVVITGLGLVAPNGIGKDAFWQGLLAGKSSIGRITRFDASRFASQISGEVKEFKPHPKIPVEHLPFMDRAYQMGVTAGFLAVEDAGVKIPPAAAGRCGVYMGLAVAGIDSYESDFLTWRREGFGKVHKNWYQGWSPSACSGYLSLILGFRGNSQVISTGCCSSVDALGVALDAIRAGQDDVALVGGTEAPVTPLGINAFCAMRALSTRNDDPEHASRPFDKERDGFVLAEGAGIAVLESLEHAQARGARIYAEVCGFGTTSNAHHMTAPDPSGQQMARAFQLAMEDADRPLEEVDVVMAHGSSTSLNEKAETLAIKKAFGPHARHLVVSAIKSMIGHPLGPAGIMEVAAGVLAITDQKVSPTINYEVPDPDCDLDCVPNTARSMPVRSVMTSSAGFSGKNTAILLHAI